MDGVGKTMKLVNFYGSEGVQAGLVRDGGIEDLAASNLWHGPAPVALSDVSALAKNVQAKIDFGERWDSDFAHAAIAA